MIGTCAAGVGGAGDRKSIKVVRAKKGPRKMKTMTTVMNEVPKAGNLHVRFDAPGHAMSKQYGDKAYGLIKLRVVSIFNGVLDVLLLFCCFLVPIVAQGDNPTFEYVAGTKILLKQITGAPYVLSAVANKGKIESPYDLKIEHFYPKSSTAGNSYDYDIWKVGDFSSCEYITSLTIPEYTFVSSYPDDLHLKSINEIAVGAFSNCCSLMVARILAPGIVTLPQSCFLGCEKLSEIEMPKIADVGEEAFAGCVGLKKVVFGSGLKSLGTDSFRGAKNLEAVSFFSRPPSGLNESHLLDHISLSQIGIPDKFVTEWVTALLQCGKDLVVEFRPTCSAVGEAGAPQRLEMVCEYADARIYYTIDGSVPTDKSMEYSGPISVVREKGEDLIVRAIAVSDRWPVDSPTVKTISYTLENGIEWIFTVSGDEAQIGTGESGVSAIPTTTKGAVKIPSTLGGCTVTSIGMKAFFGCSGLTSVTIPSSVTSIGMGAFYGCRELTSVTIPSSVTSIGDFVFERCRGLTSVTIPSNVTSIGMKAFFGCSGLTSVTIPSSVTSIGMGAFYGCRELTSVTIPSSVTSIGDFVFERCRGLTSVTIPSNVTSIGVGAFRDCSGLKSMTIPTSVTSIGESAFEYCSGLTLVTIPPSVTSIGYAAFRGCSGLNSIVFEGNAPAIGESCFSHVSSSCTAYVRHGSTGWGVDIPGKWNGINIAYMTPIDAGGGVTVDVPDSWMEPYGGYTKVNDIGANGLTYWQSYVLGLDPTDETAKVVLVTPQDGDPDKIELELNIKVPPDAGVTPTYALLKDGVKVADDLVIDLSGTGDPTGLYTVLVKIGTSEIPIEQTVGVLKGESTMTKTAISVPWGRLNGGGPVSVAELVKTANLTVGDKLHVYDRDGLKYRTWQLDGAHHWQPLATYVIAEDGSVSSESAGAPSDTTVKRGSAVLLERQDPTKPYYLFGGADGSDVTADIACGSKDSPVWNLIASPSLEPFDVKTVEGADANDQVVVPTAEGPKVYTFKDGAWGADVNVTETRTMPDGTKVEVVKRGRDTVNTTIPAGVGFWYVSQGGKPRIEWKIENGN